MIQYIQVAEDEGEEPMEVPSEDDGTLLLSTLSAQFPGACGLKYRNPDSGSMRGIRLSDGRLYPPDGSWVNRLYIAVFPKSSDTKKLREESGDMGAVKKKSEKSKCSDLIVLGLPWKSTEEDLRKYFSQIGELLMVQVKKDPKTGMSKGFGFIRFADYDAQTKCMGTRHVIDGRWCDVRIPNSKVQVEENQQNVMNRKVFVGRCTEDMTAEDLRSYFNKYGEVVDVFIPKPFRAFAFVTFSDAETAQCLCGEDHIIKGASVHISSAAPKSFDRQNDKKVMMPGHHMYSQYAAHRPWNQAGQNVGQGLGSQGTGNMPSNMGLNNLSLGAIQFTPAIMAAAQAMLSGQGGWGPVGLVSQGNSAPNVPVSGNTTPGPMNPSSAPPTGGGGDAQNQASSQSFGSIGSVSQGPPTTPIPPPTNSFLGWGGGSQGAEQGNSSAGWGTPQSKTGGTWN